MWLWLLACVADSTDRTEDSTTEPTGVEPLPTAASVIVWPGPSLLAGQPGRELSIADVSWIEPLQLDGVGAVDLLVGRADGELILWNGESLLGGQPSELGRSQIPAGRVDQRACTTGLGDLDGDGTDELGFTLTGAEPGVLAMFTGRALASGADLSLGYWVGSGAVDNYEPVVSRNVPDVAGDVDGDGLIDLIAFGVVRGGGEQPPASGHLLAGTLFDGGGDTLLVNIDAQPAVSADAQVGLGFDAGAVGDLNGDGFDDVGFLTRPYPIGEPQPAHLRIALGPDPSGDLADAVVLVQTVVSSWLALQWVPMGDLDGDKRHELAVLTSTSNPDTVEVGIIPGTAFDAGKPVALADHAFPLPNGRYDNPRWIACDLDGDGLSELIGDAIYAGAELTTPATALPRPIPGPATAASRWHCLGDVDGDGAEDVAIVGPLPEPP